MEKEPSTKQLEKDKRLADVERYLARRFTVAEIAQILSVSTRTVDRDIVEIRTRNLGRFDDIHETRKQAREHWSDALSSLFEAERMFWQISATAKSDSTKARCIWYVVQTISIRREIMHSLGLAYSDALIQSPNMYHTVDL